VVVNSRRADSPCKTTDGGQNGATGCITVPDTVRVAVYLVQGISCSIHVQCWIYRNNVSQHTAGLSHQFIFRKMFQTEINEICVAVYVGR
jgi:hypothetical protein